MIVGTAGHIDHGKTSLVRALTGVDTDRLKEEKARGISIELGYAYTPLPDGEVLGFIDVPGHEKLIHTMAAGAVGIDFALLVIAADDGIMPQTREHLAILTMLGVRRGVVALSKADRVDAARLAAVTREISQWLANTPLAQADVVPVSATTPGDNGVAALRESLTQAAQALRASGNAARRNDALFRLAVDRVFTLAGHGTVVTGTAFAGTARVGDTLTVMPQGLPVRVRSIHAQNRPVDAGKAGERCALNLAGVERDQLGRGDWIVAPGLSRPSTHVDVELHWLEGSAPLTQWFPLHVHLGTTHVQAHTVLLGGDTLAPGNTMRVQLVFDTPVCVMPGDRFIVRNPQATATVGGGRVLDPAAPERKRRSAARLAWLDAVAQYLDGNGLDGLLAQSAFGLTSAQVVALTGLPAGKWHWPATAVVLAGADDESLAFAPQAWDDVRTRVLGALRDYHARAPDEPGLDAARLGRMTWPSLDASRWRIVVRAMLSEGAVARTGAWLHLPTHRVEMTDEENALAEALLIRVMKGRFDPPWVRDMGRELNVPEERVRAVLRKLARQGRVHQIVKDLFYDEVCVQTLAGMIASADGRIEAGAFRDATGLGRKRAIQILEFFDRAGYTRRVGDLHVRRPGVEWGAA
ncbi:selenocysteine-specific translation elongation factor [Pandoraea apista]|uniref:selenocysteine-specific translation elongation factor n=1 Tax=Pandoraea apista TaxID=93218 RepID=UPI000D1AB5DF|nr:selenocysteine-specific translation elongation factor [Pandoraea apista]PTE02671.1 selenocysteine-specific translation elongation factor [Pandoraea apista]RRJ27540.1 selenocysteine-specific translation elongation factor [Pandoraea apista]RRJ73169.1 selenocysteine-specific translation elongation factor [Pandoraea apista]RSD06480.1 selenocysteine-specific translation elongation factor [Pandoraea apista]RSD11277.1 selenocysteine-specific translation elongation factor [Pandoraea apista]